MLNLLLMFKGMWLTLKAYFTLFREDSELGIFEQFCGCCPYAFVSAPEGRPGKMLLLNGAGDLVTKDVEKAEAVDSLFTSVL